MISTDSCFQNPFLSSQNDFFPSATRVAKSPLEGAGILLGTISGRPGLTRSILGSGIFPTMSLFFSFPFLFQENFSSQQIPAIPSRCRNRFIHRRQILTCRGPYKSLGFGLVFPDFPLFSPRDFCRPRVPVSLTGGALWPGQQKFPGMRHGMEFWVGRDQLHPSPSLWSFRLEAQPPGVFLGSVAGAQGSFFHGFSCCFSN